MVCEDPRLFKEWGNESKGKPPVLNALADGVDRRVIALHRIAYDNPPLTVDA